MKKLRKNDRVIKVTDGAYESVFKPQGWEVIEGSKAPKKQQQTSVEDEKTKEDKRMEKLAEKPLSKWTAKETKEFAEYHNIDVSGTKNSGEAKEIIKEHLD